MTLKEFDIHGRRVVARYRSNWPSIFTRWFVTTMAIMMVPYLVSGVHVEDIWSALAASAVLGILNALIWDFLFLLALPCAMFTLGFSIFAVNALLFLFAGAVVPGLTVDSFWSAFWASLLVSFISWVLNAFLRAGTAAYEEAYSAEPQEPQDVPPPRKPPRVRRSRRGDVTINLERDEDGKWK
jgi:putative membrane protein